MIDYKIDTKMRKHLLFLFVVLLSFFGTAVAQNPFFPTEKSAFIDHLSTYLGSSTVKQDREEAATIMEGFSSVWNSYYADNEQNEIIQLCELFHSKGGKAYANIYNFVEVLQAVPASGLSHKDVSNWLAYTNLKAKQTMNGMDKYLASCRSVFVEKVLSAKGNSKWMLRDARWSFPSAGVFELLVEGDLVLKSAKDESVLRQTKGVFRMESNSWEGGGGSANWSRFDVPADRISVELPDYYTIDLNRSEYAIDSVTFSDKHYFNEPMLGRFEDKVLMNKPEERTMYPRVVSYRSDYVIDNIFRNVDFNGGFGIMGNQIEVFGGLGKKASFVFRQGGRRKVQVDAKRFVMTDDASLVADHVAWRLYLDDTVAGKIGQDSLYHNNLGFRYDNKSRRMMAFRSLKNYGDAPFHDNYHGLDLFIEAVYWNIDETNVDFRRMESVNPKSEGDVVSVNYFRIDDFKKLQGLDGTHPMIRLERFLQGFDKDDQPIRFHIGDWASFIGFPVGQVLSLVLRLRAEGYVDYDSETQFVTVLPRFFDVIESFRDNIDYDVIKFHSVMTNRLPNCRLDLNTNDLLVFGITTQIEGIEGTAISLSDRKRVVIVPDNGRLVFKKNRDFSFSGGILAGMFEFFTKDSRFSYEDFTIDMKKVDSLRFYAKAGNRIVPVEGTLERLQGRLMIDRGDNKSSRFETAEYPIFHSDARSFKFYRRINGGVFHPGAVDSVASAEDLEGKFFYHLHPFVVDSLKDLTMRKVKFDGELVSGGIFPTFEEPLVVMDDYSLGFTHPIGKSEAESYPMFGDLGRFHQTIHLSESGFWGDGQLDYQTAEFKSERFLFYLDSVTGITNGFKMVPQDDGTLFPLAQADALKLKWDINIPELTTQTIDNPICMYGDTYFSGKTRLSPEGYAADGNMRFGLTEFSSDNFALDARTFVADSAIFRLYSADSTTIAFTASNYRANVDFDRQKVKYDYLDSSSSLDFPMNQYICSLKEAEWDMATNSLHVFNPVETFGDYATATTHEELLAINNNASKFISLVPGQDSLQFYCMSAEYDMTNYVIHAHDVKIIRVADAAVFPYMHDVDIDAESKLEPISGELLADTLNSYLLFKDALVNIHSRNHYDAQGVWDYADNQGHSTPIHMDTIKPIDGVTHGFAHIAENESFKLSTQFGFQGRLALKATEPFGYFDGQFALLAFEESMATEPVVVADTALTVEPVEMADPVLDEETAEADGMQSLNNWFASATHINPQSIRIPINISAIQEQRPEMCNGLYYKLSIDGGYFASFLAPQKSKKDTDGTAPVSGWLAFDSDSLQFIITDTTQYDAHLGLDSRGVISGTGSFDLGFDASLLDFTVHGTYTQFPNDSLTLSGLNVLNAPVFDDKVLAAMAEVYANAEGESIDLTQTPYLHYFRSGNDEAKTEERRMSIELEGYPKMEASDFYCNTIVIPDLKMVWNKQLRAFVSVGKIGLGNLGKHVVNKYVDGYVVFDRRLGNITYYFQNDMFMTYINYNCGDGQLQVHATYGDINQSLYDTREKNRTVKKDNKMFQYVAVPYESMLDFLSRLKYAGIN